MPSRAQSCVLLVQEHCSVFAFTTVMDLRFAAFALKGRESKTVEKPAQICFHTYCLAEIAVPLKHSAYFSAYIRRRAEPARGGRARRARVPKGRSGWLAPITVALCDTPNRSYVGIKLSDRDKVAGVRQWDKVE